MTTAKTPEGNKVEVRVSGSVITLHFGGVQVYWGDDLAKGLVYADVFINKHGLEVEETT